MESSLHIGNIIEKDTAQHLKEILTTIFEVGRKNEMDQSTIVEAIRMVGNVTEVKNVNIADSTFTGDKVVNMGKMSSGE